jgi:hypothetical protein
MFAADLAESQERMLSLVNLLSSHIGLGWVAGLIAI